MRWGIGLEAAGAPGKEVDEGPIALAGLLEFGVDLAGQGIGAGLDAGRALTDLNGAQPRAWDEVEGHGGGEAVEGGALLDQELGVNAAQAEDLHLSGAGGGVAVGDIHGGVGLETLAEVAAGRFLEFVTGDRLDVSRVEGGGEGALLARGDGDVGEDAPGGEYEGGVLRERPYGQGAGSVADVSEAQGVGANGVDGVGAIDVGGGAALAGEGEHGGADEGLAGLVEEGAGEGLGVRGGGGCRQNTARKQDNMGVAQHEARSNDVQRSRFRLRGGGLPKRE